MCHLYADTPEDREDLFQEILLQAWKASPNYRQQAQFSTWLYQIGLNTAISYFRKAKRSPRRAELSLADQLPIWPDDTLDVPFAQLYGAISRLGKVDKALVMLYLEEYDYSTIGQMLGITPNYVAVKMNRIKQQIRLTLQSA